MPAKIPKLYEIKTNTEQSVADLQKLDVVSNAPPRRVDAGQLEVPQETTIAQLDEIDSRTAAKIAGIQRRRKRRRWKFRSKQAAKRLLKNEHVPKPPDEPRPFPMDKKTEGITLKKRSDAASVLERLDLLVKLCEARGGDTATLAEKLASMRTVWQRVQQESTSGKINKSKSPLIETQWDVVFFGKPSSCQNRRLNKPEFLMRRSIWDSYITHGKRGSCIPRGWVLPTQEPTSEWVEYRAK
ncbi:GL23998 [Drosophila persimilis]|uniref:GL23998 n=2 Tax=Drosophila persimilis TaxID=7234 RepID=B4G2Y4_DROPE|nr:GL23998 [Drosophila persimilis]